MPVSRRMRLTEGEAEEVAVALHAIEASEVGRRAGVCLFTPFLVIAVPKLDFFPRKGGVTP